ncbi:hypothetical protein AL714_07875 [Clostridium botulinum]|uniref:hypothetical protein n=1 Tax=Clostridium botulinum TaxID=1491 RepID=UPI000773EF70|nr:hypothetical protein [Clostridium botulinum]NFA99022.1 hypothetical protein [Clostridium botulinum]NFB53995.1 hypothetical protein [Clostridium botulinum]NFC78377.1 hypothetical protein [Clostridium botulinum]NFC88909.1 hypothetical protein [Clostridium botulinum]NFD07172.1 hypothetical protein [Clostridium botulinum]
MLNIYSSFLCKSCKKEFVLLSEELESANGYLGCPYYSSRKVKKEDIADNLKERMNERSYIRIKGALRQR